MTVGVLKSYKKNEYVEVKLIHLNYKYKWRLSIYFEMEKKIDSFLKIRNQKQKLEQYFRRLSLKFYLKVFCYLSPWMRSKVMFASLEKCF